MSKIKIENFSRFIKTKFKKSVFNRKSGKSDWCFSRFLVQEKPKEKS